MNKKESSKKGNGELKEENNIHKHNIVNDNNKKNNRYKTKQRKKKGRVGKIILGIFLILVISALVFVVYSTLKNGWGFQGLLQTAMGQDRRTLENLDPLTILIMGVSKDIDSELTDTLMVASYNPKEQKAVLLSIPRDTFTGTKKNKATASQKINALYQQSPKKTLDAVNEILGLDIEKYVIIDNNALTQLVDTIGGVNFDVPIDMNYDDVTQDLHIHLTKGYQKLNGAQSEQLVRFRKNNNGTTYSTEYGDNDIGRMRTQREFLKAVAEEMIKLKNITKIGSYVDILKQNVKTNITNWDEVKNYIPFVVNFDISNLETVTLPGEPAMYNKLWFFVHDKAETQRIVDELFSNKSEEAVNDETENTLANRNENENVVDTKNGSLDKSSLKIEVLNGSSNSKKLTEVTNLLKTKGYNVFTTGTTTSTAKTTLINRSNVDSSFIQQLKVDLKSGIISNGSSSKKSNCDITVIIGKDYN